jgi:hypothetical protein
VTDGFDCPYNIQAAGPAVWSLWHEPDEGLQSLLTRWIQSWHDIAARPWRNRPSGLYPAIIRFSDEAGAYGESGDFLDPRTGFSYYGWQGQEPWLNLMLLMYQVTGEGRFLLWIEDSLAWVRERRDDAGTLGRVYDEVRRQCERVYPYWRAETGRRDYDDLFPESAPLAASGAVSTWSPAIAAQRRLVRRLAGDAVEKMRYNRGMFTREVVFTDRMYLRGSTPLEAALYGLPGGRGFGLPWFRGMIDAPSGVVGSFMITGRNRVALLLHNAGSQTAAVQVKPVHLSAGRYTCRVYRTADLENPEAHQPVSIDRRLQPVAMAIPARSERLVVIAAD